MPRIYLLTQAIVLPFFVVVLLALWFRDPDSPEKKRLRRVAPDSAILWFAAAIGFWAAASLPLGIIGTNEAAQGPALILLSLPNTLCFMMSIRGFRHTPPLFKGEGAPGQWTFLAVVAAAIDISLSVILYFTSSQNPRVYLLPDLVMNLLIVMLLTITFALSAKARGYSGLLIIALASGAALLFGQVTYVIWKIPMVPDWIWSVRLAGKLGFLITFLAIAVTWAVEEGEQAVEAESLQIRFTGEIGTKRYPCIVMWRTPGHEETCRMAPKASKQLLLLMVNRLGKRDESQLHVKEDLGTDRGGLEGVSEQLKLRFQDIIENVKSPSFSKMYRLKIPPGNIQVDARLIADAHPALRDVVAPLLD